MAYNGGRRNPHDLQRDELARKLEEMTKRAMEAEAQLAESRKSKRQPVQRRSGEKSIDERHAHPSGETVSASGRPTKQSAPTHSGPLALKLPEGYIVRSKKGPTYQVVGQIAQRVYNVTRKDTGQLFCMKIEAADNTDVVRQLKRDLFVMNDAEKHQKKFTRHFLRLDAKGQVHSHFNYIVMTAASYDLNQVRSVYMNDGDFSRETAARLCVYFFQAIHDLHSMGYVHRDIRPSKFVIGRERPDMAYLIGFSLAYQFKEDGTPSRPTALPKQIVNKFRSRSYHKGREVYRKDDLESWVYICVNLFARKLLPWHNKFPNTQMFMCKERFFCNDYDDVFKTVPRQVRTIMHNLDKIRDAERPDYTFLGMMLLSMREDFPFLLNGPFDFQKDNLKAPPRDESPTQRERVSKGLEVANAEDRKTKTRQERTQWTEFADDEPDQNRQQPAQNKSVYAFEPRTKEKNAAEEP